MQNKSVKFILAVGLQIIVIFAIIIFKLSILSDGTDLFIRIAPVDPRDWLRGDYTTFQYDISNANYYGYDIKNSDTVYVSLYKSGKYWNVASVHKTMPTGDQVFIKGVVKSGGQEAQGDPYEYRSNSGRLHIEYGIEQYFIPEGKGWGFSFQGKESVAHVVVDEYGNPVLKQVYVDGKPWP